MQAALQAWQHLVSRMAGCTVRQPSGQRASALSDAPIVQAVLGDVFRILAGQRDAAVLKLTPVQAASIPKKPRLQYLPEVRAGVELVRSVVTEEVGKFACLTWMAL